VGDTKVTEGHLSDLMILLHGLPRNREARGPPTPTPLFTRVLDSARVEMLEQWTRAVRLDVVADMEERKLPHPSLLRRPGARVGVPRRRGPLRAQQPQGFEALRERPLRRQRGVQLVAREVRSSLACVHRREVEMKHGLLGRALHRGLEQLTCTAQVTGAVAYPPENVLQQRVRRAIALQMIQDSHRAQPERGVLVLRGQQHGEPVGGGTQPRILAIDPADEKKVYLRLLTGPSDAMSVTPDGGQTFQTVLTISGQFSSFLRAGDGAIYAGTMDGKLYVRSAGAAVATDFTSRSAPHLRCLGQRRGTARIYACADMIVDGFSLASSDDNGMTFQPVMSFTQLLGPLTCAPVQNNCQSHWERIKGVLGIGTSPDAGQGGGGGSVGASGRSQCASAGADTWGLWVMLAFIQRRRRNVTVTSVAQHNDRKDRR
jgi:hypothetical protein